MGVFPMLGPIAMSWGNTEYKGKGKIKCYICGKQVRKHKIGPCPEAPGRITAARVGRRYVRHD
jgi:hypothetical protein